MRLNSISLKPNCCAERMISESAHQVYTKALDIFEDNNDLLYARGLNAADLKRIDLLENDLRKILASQPDHADALNALGYTLADQTNRLDEAKGYIQQAPGIETGKPRHS